MTDRPDIQVVPVDAPLRPALLALGVHDEQYAFVGRVADSLADAESCEGSEPMAVLCDGEPIGFYRVEKHARTLAGVDFEHPTLGLRSFFIDARWQGRGLGRLALMAAMRDMALRHPMARDVALTVNLRNAPGLALYLRAGFRETGGLYHGGRSGPQYLMLCALPR
ncbi:GNAT family N-acetyltransferase [Dyella solisilvae]|uniref:GNAT family N-acetyltransferase n=1 Tax=Dyella solisilvae TaxID=1920168 RepID=A0A370K986_9GAMM|nr:GNAT family N-acetyltransferase [Dyella solisilvae]RDI99199.1 GNAT family N-acetyltransferase [Dyella solisilvae]